ncbi:MAG: putative toxin-antitoxin system toxin component, PIN family [bacterium]|nr:putative toxin-antitoxin system toxin component, PIN family [bacterium]
MPKKVFLDANVWFSAAHSQRGGSFFIMRLARAGLLAVCANQHVLDEAERNLLFKSYDSLTFYYSLLTEIRPTIVSSKVSPEFEKKYGKFVPAGDLPVLSGAMDSKAEYLITLDRRDLANPKIRNFKWPFLILTPREFLEWWRKEPGR